MRGRRKKKKIHEMEKKEEDSKKIHEMEKKEEEENNT